MKNIVKTITRIAVVYVLTTTMLTGCRIFGLEMQESYDYDYSAGMRNNQMNCTVWEFLLTHRSDFDYFVSAIEYAGMQNMYNDPNATYVVLRNNCFTSSTNGFFVLNYLFDADGVVYTPSTVRDYPIDVIRQLLLYHIVEGLWTHTNLPPGPTWYHSYADGETAYVNLYMSKSSPPNIRFNDFVGHYVTGSTCVARTTNLQATSGAYMHILNDFYMQQPTLDQLR